jgi:kynurenine formamidase
VAFQGLEFKPGEVDLIDLSAPIRRFSMEPQETILQNHPAERRRRQWAKRLNMKVSQVDARGAWDRVILTTCAGTHMKAPFCFAPEVGGKAAKRIEQVPLEWCYGQGVLLDFRHLAAIQPIEVKDLREALGRIGHTLQKGDIVMLRTGAEDHFDTDPKFPDYGAGLSRESLFWLLDQGIKVIGTDAESLDRPLSVMLEDSKRRGFSALFPVHLAAREREHCQVLKLYNLKSLPRPTGFQALIAPVKIEGAGSGWARAVAFVKK